MIEGRRLAHGRGFRHGGTADGLPMIRRTLPANGGDWHGGDCNGGTAAKPEALPMIEGRRSRRNPAKSGPRTLPYCDGRRRSRAIGQLSHGRGVNPANWQTVATSGQRRQLPRRRGRGTACRFRPCNGVAKRAARRKGYRSTERGGEAFRRDSRRIRRGLRPTGTGQRSRTVATASGGLARPTANASTAARSRTAATGAACR